MRYPDFLPKKGTIGLVAPSFGVCGFPYEDLYVNAKAKFNKLGYNIKESDHLYGIEKGASAPAQIRGQEFMKMYLDDEVDFIDSVAGGEIMVEMLPYVDFEAIKKAKPKYFMGMSDNTCLTLTLNVKSDTASIYGCNFGSFGMRRWHQSVKDNYLLMTGQKLDQHSYPRCEDKSFVQPEDAAIDPLGGFKLKNKVEYKSLDGSDCRFTGRLIGGCLEVVDLLMGTPYCDLDEYFEKYKEDGFIWFLEACEYTILQQKCVLWSMKQAGFFKYCKGVMYGRPGNGADFFGATLEDVLKDTFEDLQIPVVYGCDFGHVAPCMTIISGAVGTFSKVEDKGYLTYDLR